MVRRENTVQEVVGGNVIEEAEDGIGAGQTLTYFVFKGLHRIPATSETREDRETT